MANEITLGKLIEDPNEGRDAIHIATAPVVASETLNPGERIGFVKECDTEQVGKASKTVKTIGIVDPFLVKKVQKGERFFMCLFPNTIKSLRHEWTHDDFEQVDAQKVLKAMNRLNNHDSIEFLTKYAKEVEMEFDDLIEAAKSHLVSGDYVHIGFDTPDMVYSKRREFWRHFSAFTGQEVADEDNEKTFFSCAC